MIFWPLSTFTRCLLFKHKRTCIFCKHEWTWGFQRKFYLPYMSLKISLFLWFSEFLRNFIQSLLHYSFKMIAYDLSLKNFTLNKTVILQPCSLFLCYCYLSLSCWSNWKQLHVPIRSPKMDFCNRQGCNRLDKDSFTESLSSVGVCFAWWLKGVRTMSQNFSLDHWKFISTVSI